MGGEGEGSEIRPEEPEPKVEPSCMPELVALVQQYVRDCILCCASSKD